MVDVSATRCCAGQSLALHPRQQKFQSVEVFMVTTWRQAISHQACNGAGACMQLIDSVFAGGFL
jgi:hypothetical protein